jgi:hypothetical protein
MNTDDPLLKEEEEHYNSDLWLYTGTHGPDMQYYKQHIYSARLEDSLCGMNSKFFEVQKIAIIGMPDNEILIKEDTTSSVYMSFRTMRLTRDTMCKRCAKRATDRLADQKIISELPKTPTIPEFPNIHKGDEVLPPGIVSIPTSESETVTPVTQKEVTVIEEKLEIVPEDNRNKDTSIIPKLSIAKARNMEDSLDWVKYYFPTVSEKEGRKILMTRVTNYPVNLEKAIDELYHIYLKSIPE